MKFLVYLLMGLLLPLLAACGEDPEEGARRERYQQQRAFVAACQVPKAIAAQGFAAGDDHFRTLWGFDKPRSQWQCVYTRRVLTYDHNSCRRQVEYTTDGKHVWAWKSVLFRGSRCDDLRKEYARNSWATERVPAF